MSSKIDQVCDKIVDRIPDDMVVTVSHAIEKTYGETGNGQIYALSQLGYAKQYLKSFIYDQVASVFGIEE